MNKITKVIKNNTIETRQVRRARYRKGARSMARNMEFTHRGVPRNERRSTAFKIQKEKERIDIVKEREKNA